ncbi:MAG: hypothetical protein NZ700_12295 [Gemmataceae bacterium]|nr:hypothetical protein [Gemmataceae bacterium]MDW8265844.1 hypothetical protein [Gemmataceae bacterium]
MMDRKEASTWVMSVCGALRRTQAKTPGERVRAALQVCRVSLSAIGRALDPGTMR